MAPCCDMKGHLTFLVLLMIGKKNMTGEEIRQEIEKRKGTKPSPGTIYPVLKHLSEGRLIEEVTHGKEKSYSITPRGRQELKIAMKQFMSMFCDMKEEFKKI